MSKAWVTAHTDGAATSGGTGSWAFVLTFNGHRLKKWGRMKEKRTGNQMEMQGAIEALTTIRPGSNVTIYSDSQYLVFGMNDKTRKRAVNGEFWEVLEEVANAHAQVLWNWIPREQNAEADLLAKKALSLPPGQERE